MSEPKRPRHRQISNWLGQPESGRMAGWRWAVLLSLIVVGGVCTAHISLHHVNKAPSSLSPDASVLIGTFVSLYGLFIAGFGVLATFVSSRRRYQRLRFIAVAFLIEASAMDLYCVWSSTDDLYGDIVGGLTQKQLFDDVHDFWIYFTVNAVVSAFIITVAVQPQFDRVAEVEGPPQSRPLPRSPEGSSSNAQSATTSTSAAPRRSG
jgi:hypothetical protein